MLFVLSIADLIELQEYVVVLFRCYADAAVAHFDLDPIAAVATRQHDATGMRIADGIGQQIGQDPMQKQLIGHNDCTSTANAQMQLLL